MKALVTAEAFREAAVCKGLYVASKTDIPELVSVSVDGYGSGYPLCQWLDQGGDGTCLENRTVHSKGWISTWKANLSYIFEQSVIIADSPHINAMAVWLMPYSKEASSMKWFLCGGLESLFHMGLMEMVRFDTYEKFCTSQRRRYGADSFYLNNLVVRKSSQGEGLGTHLMASSLEIIGQAGSSAYLETHTQKNMDFYRRLGFRLMSDEPVPGTLLRHYAMRFGVREGICF